MAPADRDLVIKIVKKALRKYRNNINVKQDYDDLVLFCGEFYWWEVLGDSNVLRETDLNSRTKFFNEFKKKNPGKDPETNGQRDRIEWALSLSPSQIVAAPKKATKQD